MVTPMAKKRTTKKTTPKKTESKTRQIHTPHDRVFRFALKKPERAAALVRAHLKEKYLKHLDLDSIEAFTTDLKEDEICEDPAVRLTLGLMRAVAKNKVAAWLKEHLPKFEEVENDDEES